MNRRIGPQTSLDNLRKEAKRWLRALRDGAHDARSRFERAHPAAPPHPGLRDVQLALAREYGFAGWTDLKAALATRSGAELPIERFLDYACPDHHVRGVPAHRIARHAAVRMLQRNPRLARASLATAVVCGELEEVDRILRARPEDLFEDLGPKGWQPLLFLCFTRLPLRSAERSARKDAGAPQSGDNAVAIARALLDRGADPNVFFMAGDSRYTPLVGVIGEGEEDRPPHPRRDELARLLLDRGAEPYDLQVVYNIGFHGKVLWFLKLMHEYSSRAGRQADWDDPEWRMLDMGGYGTGARWHLRIAVEHDDLELAEWCLTHGADPNAAPERDERFPQRSLYELALLQGRTAMAELLSRHGAAVRPVVREGVEVAAFLESSSAPRRSIADVEQVALDLVQAHDTGDAAALERLGRHYGRTLTHGDVRAGVWRRVYALRQRAADGGERRLEVAEARELIAREAGFGNWTAFVEATAAGRPAPGTPYQIDRKENRIAPRRVLTSGEWDAVLGVMNEERITALRGGGEITDAILARVADLGSVTRLDLEGARQISDDGLQHLARMPQLIELDLSGCALTDRALDVLRHLPNLRRFHMRWQKGISDAGVENLAFCEQIESVDLMGTQTGDGAIRALAGKAKLHRFKSGRLVTDAGLAPLHDLPVFRTWQGGEMRYSLMDPDAGPNQLLLDGPFTNDGVASLVGLDGLFALSFFWHASAITPDAFAPLAQLPNLGFLGCEGTLCDDAAMRHISAIPRLRMLVAQGTVATDDGFTALSRSRTLEYLWGRECPNLTGRGFAALSRLPALRGLGVSCKGVDDAALATLPQFAALRELMPMDVQDDGFRHVGRCEQLETLWCMYCRDTTDLATDHINGLSRLKTYYAGKTRITDRSLETLSAMESLERLTFWETAGITDAGVRLLKTLPRLRELSLEGLPHVTADVAAEFPAEVRLNYVP